MANQDDSVPPEYIELHSSGTLRPYRISIQLVGCHSFRSHPCFPILAGLTLDQRLLLQSPIEGCSPGFSHTDLFEQWRFDQAYPIDSKLWACGTQGHFTCRCPKAIAALIGDGFAASYCRHLKEAEEDLLSEILRFALKLGSQLNAFPWFSFLSFSFQCQDQSLDRNLLLPFSQLCYCLIICHFELVKLLVFGPDLWFGVVLPT